MGNKNKKIKVDAFIQKAKAQWKKQSQLHTYIYKKKGLALSFPKKVLLQRPYFSSVYMLNSELFRFKFIG